MFKSCPPSQDLVQGCLLTAENLLNLGRVEKRTLFQVSASKLLNRNEHLVSVLKDAAKRCHEQSHNCLVARWLPPDERYHILQASINAMSSLLGPNYVHQNALGDTDLFKSTWYCVTIMTPTRAENHLPDEQKVSATTQSLETCTFTDMTRTPRPTLRICLVHESELRGISDGKLQPPSWGFFNSRHAERYRMLCDFSRNFQQQLVRTPADSKSLNSRSPFTSERAHKAATPAFKPDGGMMKRIVSQPNLQLLQKGVPQMSIGMGRIGRDGGEAEHVKVAAATADEADRSKGACDDNCFLRLHVPHYVGPTSGFHKPVIHHTGDNGSQNKFSMNLADGSSGGSRSQEERLQRTSRVFAFFDSCSLSASVTWVAERKPLGLQGDLLRGKADPTVDEPLQQLKAVLERKRTEVGLIRLRAVSADQWPGALCKLKRLLGPFLDESLLRDVLLRWFHIALWDSWRRAPPDGVGQEADTLDEESASTPLAKIEVVPQALLAGQEALNGTRVTLVAAVDSQVWRTEGGLVSHGKSVWPASSHFTFEVFSWKSALEVQVLASSPAASSPSEVGSSRLEVLALIPNRWHRLKETLWGGTSRPQIEVGIYVSIEPPSSRPGAEPLGEVQAVEADSMPQPTQRELQKMKLQELLHDPEERSAEKESKPHRDGKSQRELQREELERLLSDGGPPTEEQRKKDRIRSLEAKIAEMQAELEAERSSERAKSDVRQKRDQRPS
ncbi:Catsper1 [Symbiodinium sp. CCMP2456]|nr:Catsper1 [Symbiodinium sp. CCMP2456]